MVLSNTSAPTRPATDDSLRAAYDAFRKAYPAFDSTADLDELRARDYSRLDKAGQIYLDFTGGGLYAESQINAHMDLLKQNVFGNPHSTNPTSLAMTRLVESARQYVHQYFNASPDEYEVIFTPNATGALKIVGESYPFGPGSNYLLSFDNHNSVNGIREFAHARGATVTYVPLVPPDLHLDVDKLRAGFDLVNPAAHNLFAYPAQSNFSGAQHSLDWIAEAKAKGWDVLLDAAAFAPTNRLDLSLVKPDFVDFSFYKIFGYPTGVGALIVRKEIVHKLHRPWYAGGTVACASVQGESHLLTPGPSGFEDGTVNYLSLPAVEIGLRHIEKIGIEKIHTRVMTLSAWLIDQLLSLRHSNGKPVLRLYGPAGIENRGATIEANYYDPDEKLIECHIVESLANAENISLRAGCHCNPGASEISLGFTEQEMVECLRDKERMSYEQFMEVVDSNKAGGVRASLGLVTTFEDVHRYVQFAKTFVDRPVEGLSGVHITARH